MKAAIALGSNLGDREAHLRDGLARVGMPVLAVSSLYETDPVGPVEQGDFLNAVAVVETADAPRELMARLLAAEEAEGRRRTVPMGPRTLDLDLLLMDDTSVDEEGVKVPHPRLSTRAFVLVPLLEVWPEARFPGGGPVRSCLTSVSGVRFYRSAAWYPHIAGRSTTPS